MDNARRVWEQESDCSTFKYLLLPSGYSNHLLLIVEEALSPCREVIHTTQYHIRGNPVRSSRQVENVTIMGTVSGIWKAVADITGDN